ncbi:prolipoprotein diacylglyceryl transferase [Gordonia sp. QH-12]|uniref:prolipoprotein diacylglyceryl transferase n=1 Tax=Gordonia sp. QH-12 TaxID=1437876 RepID=UPI0007838A0A|nr:prolipoprotein diacylglyceryl transferase [Gordonia sp. QH-12]KXT56263.1 prolipoprotein diacylglyceryl transferase [Gordonia sp. QH-12]
MTDGTVLAYIPSPPQGVWYLGPVPIRAYALFIIVGIVVAVWWGSRRWRARGGQPGEVVDVALWAVPFGLIGGRLYHVLTDWSTYFGAGGKGLGAVFRIWDGGLGIWGAVALGAVGAWLGARTMGIRLPPFGDAIAPAILLAQAIGRLGNYFNQELFGRPTTVPWGLGIYDRSDSSGVISYKLIDGVSTGNVYAVVHPTFLYELLWNVFFVVVLVLVDRRFRIGHGRLFALYVAGYCVGRFVVELMRDDYATHIFGVRVNVFTAAIVFLCAALYFVMAPKGREQGLSMYWPRKAEELAAEGAVGYVPPEMDDEAADEDRAVYDDETLHDEAVDDETLYDDQAVYEDEVVDEGPADYDAEAGTHDEAASEVPEAAEPEFEVAATSDALFAPEADSAEAAVGADETDETETDAAETGAAETDAAETDAAGSQPEGTVVPGVEPSIAESTVEQGYTIVPADDEELSGITIIEQNPGGSAGSIEIRRSDDAPEPDAPEARRVTEAPEAPEEVDQTADDTADETVETDGERPAEGDERSGPDTSKDK